MYWKRWLTALVLIPPLILLILKAGQLLFAIFIIATAVLCLWEYFRIAFAGHEPPVPTAFRCWGYLAGAALVAAAACRHYPLVLMALALNFLGAAILSIPRFKINTDAPVVAVKQAFGILYIPLSLAFVVLLRDASDGPYWVLFLMWVVAWGDTGALYAGSYFGRHKLCPAVSPKKTVEGAIGGLISNLAFAWIFKLLIFPGMNGLTCTVFALTVGAVGQIGDLFESEFKRAAGVKDSGTLLPGHGGFLDRLDALMLSAPMAFLLKEYLLP
jgi:phosphatidate cytidylyltransferase